MGLFNERSGNNRSVLQHVFQIYQVAVVHVLRKVIGVVEVDNALFVRLYHIFGKKDAGSKVLRNLARHVVALNRVYRRVLVGVFLLNLFVVTFDESKDFVVGGVGMALDVLHITVNDVPTGNFKLLKRHNLVFYHILDFLNGNGMAGGFA